MKNKTELQFMVDPEFLINNTFITDPVKVKIIDPDSIFITGLLGESGRKMMLSGADFIFTKPLAEKLIKHGVAVAY